MFVRIFFAIALMLALARPSNAQASRTYAVVECLNAELYQAAQKDFDLNVLKSYFDLPAIHHQVIKELRRQGHDGSEPPGLERATDKALISLQGILRSVDLSKVTWSPGPHHAIAHYGGLNIAIAASLTGKGCLITALIWPNLVNMIIGHLPPGS